MSAAGVAAVVFADAGSFQSILERLHLLLLLLQLLALRLNLFRLRLNQIAQFLELALQARLLPVSRLSRRLEAAAGSLLDLRAYGGIVVRRVVAAGLSPAPLARVIAGDMAIPATIKHATNARIHFLPEI